MTIIPEGDRDMIEQAIYLPILIKVLNRDLKVVEISPFKIKRPYFELIVETMKVIQNDLAKVKRYMYKNKIKVERLESDEGYTKYFVMYKGYEVNHNYKNVVLRTRSDELLGDYMLNRHKDK